MDSKEVTLLKKALERQKKARQQAERILEEKSKELYDVTHHLKATNSKLENLLNEKAAELDGEFINIIDPYVVMDLKFNVINMNLSAKAFLGYDHTQEHLNLAHIVHPDFLEYTAQSFKALVEVGTLKNYRAKILTKHKTEKWVLINSSLIYDARQQPIAAQGIVRDITQEMEIKQLLAEQKKELNTIVENSPLGIVLAVEDRIVKVNGTFARLLGYSENELKQMRIGEISAPEDMASTQKLIDEMNNGQLDQFSMVKRYFKKDGGFLVARTLVSAVTDEAGKFDYQLALVEDITKEREAEERLKNEREKYSSIIANMNLGLIEVDNDDVIQMVNHSFCTMSGFDKEELIGTKAAEVVQVQDKTIIHEKHSDRLAGQSDSYEVEVRNKKGAVRHWLISGAPRYDNAKNVVGSIGIHLDITDQKQLELQKEKLLKELEKSNEGLQEYAHIVSHDLKSPLRSINALSTWLIEDYYDKLDDNGKFNLQQIQEKVEGMDRLIDGILKYSSITDTNLDNTVVDVNEVVGNIREIIFVPEHVNIIIMNTLPHIRVDQTKIHQLFQNLIGNAVVHIDRNDGLVEISSEDEGSHWRFSVKDNGVGIPKAYHEKIFKVFQSIGTNERSTGIGLSIVKKIVDLYQGRIWLESEIGQGTTFHFTLKK